MRISEREVGVEASYASVFEPALGALYEGLFPKYNVEPALTV